MQTCFSYLPCKYTNPLSLLQAFSHILFASCEQLRHLESIQMTNLLKTYAKKLGEAKYFSYIYEVNKRYLQRKHKKIKWQKLE